MPENRPLAFDHEASLEELAGVGKNRQFDAVIDDEDSEEIQVICRRLNPTPKDDTDKYIDVSLSKPSRAFYFGDREFYLEESKRFDKREKERVLNTDQFRKNAQVFEKLKRSCQHGFVIPFVGAGMSVSAGLPTWTGYMLRLCQDAGLDQAIMEQRLRTTGDYEGAINDIIEKLGIRKFERDFEHDFAVPETVTGPVTLLPKLFNRCAVTTNFDQVLEKVYEQEGAHFVDKVAGRGSSNHFYRAIPSGDRFLLKLHGNVSNARERVLLRGEYESAYGPGDNIHFESPLPILLKRLFMSYSFLFLGCSLATDRTVVTLMKVAQELGGDQLPHHYAVLQCPAQVRAREILDQRLADAHITPLWYPESEHEHVEQILELLLD